MQRYITPDQLVSPADFVDPDQDYDWTLYNPRERVYWDPSFSPIFPTSATSLRTCPCTAIG